MPAILPAAPALLAVVQYNVSTTYTTVSNTLVDVDAANLAITFTTPVSGRVLVVLGALGDTTAVLTDGQFWGLRESTSIVADNFIMGNAAAASRGTARILITGLTPGSLHTYKWGIRRAAAGTVHLYCGGANGPAIMEVWTA